MNNVNGYYSCCLTAARSIEQRCPGLEAEWLVRTASAAAVCTTLSTLDILGYWLLLAKADQFLTAEQMLELLARASGNMNARSLSTAELLATFSRLSEVPNLQP